MEKKVEVEMVEVDSDAIVLNDNDIRLLEFCKGRPKSVREIANHLDIAPKNVSVRLEKLKNKKLIQIDRKGIGKKTRVKTREDDKLKHFNMLILKALKEKGGEMNIDDFHKLNPFDPKEMGGEGYDKFYSTLNIQYSDLVDHIIKISDKGKKFLEENG